MHIRTQLIRELINKIITNSKKYICENFCPPYIYIYIYIYFEPNQR